MRLALLTTSFPAFAEDPSGHFVEAHARELASRGELVTVLALGEGKLRRPSDDLDVRWLGGARLFGWPGAAARARQSPLRVLHALLPLARMTAHARRFDKIVAHWIVPSAIPVAWLASPSELEVWAHGADVRLLTAFPRLGRLAIRSLLAKPARFVFVSEALLAAMLSVLDPETARRLRARSRVEAAPLAIPAREALPDPRAPGELTRGYAVWVGRPTPSKRPEVALRAARTAGVDIVMVGIDAVDGARSSCRGRIPRREALRWIAHAIVLVSTSEAEGASSVIREARALGVPVFAFPAGDVEARAERDDGIVVVRSERELADRLLSLVVRPR